MPPDASLDASWAEVNFCLSHRAGNLATPELIHTYAQHGASFLSVGITLELALNLKPRNLYLKEGV